MDEQWLREHQFRAQICGTMAAAENPRIDQEVATLWKASTLRLTERCLGNRNWR